MEIKMINNFIPEGVADLNYDEYEKMQVLEESVSNTFKELGYRQILTPTFEFYDLFADEEISTNTEDMYKIMDSSGKLMVLRPDATVPIARMMATHYKESDGDIKLMYMTNVFRSADFRAGGKREFKQAGIEHFASKGAQTDASIILSAHKALQTAGFADLMIELGDANYFNGFISELAEYQERFATKDIQMNIWEMVEKKNIPGLDEFAKSNDLPEKFAKVLMQIPLLYGDIGEVTENALKLALNDTMKQAVENVININNKLGREISVSADFGLVNRLDYYSGMIFKIYLEHTGVMVGSGGRYDKLMKKFGRDIPAAGFGLNMDILYEASQKTDSSDENVLTIALGKGRLAEITMEKLETVGITFPEYTKKSRKLIFDDSTGKIRIVFVKAVDVGIYVEKGACDVGVIGKDTLLESGSDVFEMIDMNYGKCIFAVAGPGNFKYNPKKKLRVATKYPHVAKKYFAGLGHSIEIIKINGSVELAPLVGLSDVIVDIVETGTTLKENGLEVIEKITNISARFIANRASLKTKEKQVSDLMRLLKSEI